MQILLLLLLAVAPALCARHPTVPRPANPFLDPFNDPYNPLRYIASNTLTTIAVVLVGLVALIQTWYVIKYKTRWMLSMTIGCYTFTLGLALRYLLHKNPEGKGLYIAEYLFVVLSPCAFIASEYVLLGRLARFLSADEHLLVRSSRITKIFIASDLSTFLIQAIGGSISVGTNSVSSALLGSHIFLAGLVLQLLSFLTFSAIFLVFVHRVRKHMPETWAVGGGWWVDWRTLLAAMCLSFTGIIIRSIYRVAELGQGFHGHLATTEKFFYGLDTFPLFIAIVAYVPFWPGRFIRTPDARVAVVAAEKRTPLDTPDERSSAV